MGRFADQFVRFGIGVYLARLLSPREFGLLTMAMVFSAFAQVFVDSGFGQSLIQAKEVDEEDKSTVFFFNLMVSSFVCVVVFLLAPYIANFFETPILEQMVQVLSILPLIKSGGLVHQSILTRNMEFKTLFAVSNIATVLSGATGLTMAIMGFGVWSLVAATIASSTVRTICFWVFHRWRPMLAFNFSKLKKLGGFGIHLFFAGLLDTTFKSIYSVLISKLYSPFELGLFDRAKRLRDLPIFNVTQAVSKVSFPLFSQVQSDTERMKRGVQKALRLLSFAVFPIALGLASVAPVLIPVLLGSKWNGCVIYLQILCFAGMLYPLQIINLNVIKARGHSQLFLRLEVVKKTILVLIIAATCPFGVTYLVVGQLVMSIIAYFINSYFSGKQIGYSIADQIFDFAPYLAAAMLMGVSVFALSWIEMHQVVLLTIQVVTGVCLYVLICKLLQFDEYVEVLQIIKQRSRKLYKQFAPPQK